MSGGAAAPMEMRPANVGERPKRKRDVTEFMTTGATA